MQLIRGIDGVKIAVYDPNPCGKREVLMVHGWPLSAKMYEYQERLLLEHGGSARFWQIGRACLWI